MTESTSPGRTLLREVRRRKLPRACILYIVACWIVLQVSEIVFSALGMDWALASRLLLIATFAGFPVLVFIAWFFRFGTNGITRHPPFVERRTLGNIAPIGERRQGAPPRGDKPAGAENYSWIIEMETGPLAGHAFGIDGEMVIGRALECDLTLPSAQVSRQHARLLVDQGGLVIEDLGSSNGTAVNGALVRTPVKLRHDDAVEILDIRIRVRENVVSGGGHVPDYHAADTAAATQRLEERKSDEKNC